MAKNLQSLQLLRNSNLYQTKAAAKEALEDFIADHPALGNLDGVAILARYNDGASVKTLLGLAYSGGTQYVTVFDPDVAEILADLDAASVSGESKVVIDVTQEDGQITALAANLTGVKLDGLTAGSDAKIAAADTLGEALAKIQAQIDAMDLSAVGTEGSVITEVSEADGKVSASATPLTDIVLVGFDSNSGVTGDVASTDSVENAINKLQNTIKAAQHAVTVNNTDGSINVATATTGTSIDVNIKSGEKVLAKDGGNGLYTDIQLSSVTTSSTNVKEEYALVGINGAQLGNTTVKIYKDSAYVEIYLGTSADTIDATTGAISKQEGDKQSLNYAYVKADGTYDMAKVDVSAFLSETEFQSGVTATDHIVHGVVDNTSENFLTVGANGFKLSGVQDAINSAVSGAVETLDADVSGNSTHVTVNVVEADGKITTVNVAEDDIASADDLEELSGKTVTAVEMTGGTAAIAAHTDGTKKITINTDGSQIDLTGYVKGSDSGSVIATDSVNDAISKLENQIDAVSEAAGGDVSELSAKTVTVINMTGGTATTGAAADGTVEVNLVTDGDKLKMTGYDNTVTGNVEATDSVNAAVSKVENKAKDAQNEIDAIETAVGLSTGGTYVQGDGTYTSAATSVADAIDKLDYQVKANADAIEDLTEGFISAITVNGSSAVTVTNNVADLTITSATGATTATGNEAITVETGDNGEITLGLATIDCGYFDA